MRRVVCSIAVVAAAMLASPLRAQDSMAFLGGDRETATQVARIVESARSQGLPTDPIISKAQQGALFHSAPARIVSAAKAVARRLESARAALAPSPTPADIAAGENALSIQGVSTKELRAVRAVSPNKPVAVPIGVLAQLVASGVSASDATSIVTELMQRGASNVQLVALGSDVNADVAAGTRADAALGVRLNGLVPFLAPSAGGQSAITLTTPGIAGAAATHPSGQMPGGPKKP
ncbi:MAG TPA: hypothetical protein VGM50_01695 [Gemmatimonadaceae bacterium]|jgi:hypothetical protein